MGAGQIGGIATLLDIDFNNAAGFVGEKASPTEGQFIVYFFSHAMMFCVGGLIESHIVLTPARCVFGERQKFEVYGGTHSFLENSGVIRMVHHIGVHRGFNYSSRLTDCTTDNLAILVLSQAFAFDKLEFGGEFVINRIRYGSANPELHGYEATCNFFGWGSRRNGYLIPLLIYVQKMEVKLLPLEKCIDMWNKDDNYLCIEHTPCKSEKYGALCPDDAGSILVCKGFAQGMMISRLVDRPCGVGFLDLTKFTKFLTCGVDDAREVIATEETLTYDFDSAVPMTPTVVQWKNRSTRPDEYYETQNP